MIRRIGAAVLAAPLAIGFPVFFAAPASAASTGITSPASGAVIKSGTQVEVKAKSGLAHYQLRVTAPGTGEKTLDDKLFGGDLSGTVAIPRNGKYSVAVVRVRILGGPVTEGTSTFTVRVPPAQPAGLTATASGGKLKVSWTRGGEVDLSGYTVGVSGKGSQTGAVSKFCSGAACSATFAAPASGTVKVNVYAKRSNGLGGTVSSGIASTNLTINGGQGGSGGGGTTLPPPTGTAPSLPGTGAAPTTSTPLTAFNNQSPVTLPSVQPDGATPGYTYPAPQVAGQQGTPTAADIPVPAPLQWGRSVGIALVLLVIAAHLGTWTRRLRVAQAGLSSKGMAARAARGGTGRKRVSRAKESITEAEALARTAVLSLGTKKRPTTAAPVAEVAAAPTSKLFREPGSAADAPFLDPAKPPADDDTAPPVPAWAKVPTNEDASPVPTWATSPKTDNPPPSARPTRRRPAKLGKPTTRKRHPEKH